MSGSAQQLDQVRDASTAPDQRRGDRPRGRLIDRHTALVGAKAPTYGGLTDAVRLGNLR
jgi:hypothetical protein